MPELPEVETVRQGLIPVLVGQKIVRVQQNRADLRFPFPVDFQTQLTHATITSIERRAKYLLVSLDNGQIWLTHLGMSGRFRVEDAAPLGVYYHKPADTGVHDHVILTLENGVRVTYTDPRRFGFMDVFENAQRATHPRLQGLGIEPLPELSGVVLHSLMAKKRVLLKSALLNQRLIAGLGNIYVCEALFRAKLPPERLALTLTLSDAECLAQAIVTVLKQAVQAGGSSLRDHRQVDGAMGYFQHTFAVYDREGEACVTPMCLGLVERRVHTGRSTFFCPMCQT
jgi:formamidopyrimidine-DNA glycosylase